MYLWITDAAQTLRPVVVLDVRPGTVGGPCRARGT